MAAQLAFALLFFTAFLTLDVSLAQEADSEAEGGAAGTGIPSCAIIMGAALFAMIFKT